MLKIGRKGEHRLSVVLSKPSGVSAPCSGTPSFARFLRACQAVSGFRAFGRVVPSAWDVLFCSLVLADYSGRLSPSTCLPIPSTLSCFLTAPCSFHFMILCFPVWLSAAVSHPTVRAGTHSFCVVLLCFPGREPDTWMPVVAE